VSVVQGFSDYRVNPGVENEVYGAVKTRLDKYLSDREDLQDALLSADKSALVAFVDSKRPEMESELAREYNRDISSALDAALRKYVHG
jgi:hypothetical protein